MSITRIALKSVSDGEASSERNGLLAEIVRRKYKIELWVYTNSARSTQIDVLGDVLTPKIGDTFAVFGAVDALATCVSINCTRTQQPFVWLFSASYDTDRLVAAITNNPLNQPPDIDYGAVLIDKPQMRDVTGMLIVASSVEPYDPPITKPKKRLQVTIIQNLETYDSVAASHQIDACNSNVVTVTSGTFNPYTIRIADKRGHKQISYGIQYYQVHTVLEIDTKDTWADFVLDQSFRDKDRQLFRDPLDFSLPGNPTLLNGRGYALRDSVVPLTHSMSDSQTEVALDRPVNVGTEDEGIVDDLFPPNIDNSGGYIKSPNYYYYIQIEDEIMKVTHAEFSTGYFRMTVVRGYSGTTAVQHLASTPGITVKLLPYFRLFYNHDTIDFSTLGLPDF